MKIKLDAFKREPSLCWYWKCDQYQTQEFMRMVNSLSKSETYVLLEGEKVVGYGGIALEPQNAYWGSCSGIDLALTDKYRGQGLSYSLYSFLFNEMTSRGAVFYKGATANPGVMKAAAYLERWPLFYQLLPKNFRVQ